ncbi:hypothetical protein DL96DRAFT_1819783 [Flagelloscypha sp. PMI_526]|nr:hypothetical protein DL96DRAFT_1819783 [Flagelloscypha sp. PMI_526]
MSVDQIRQLFRLLEGDQMTEWAAVGAVTLLAYDYLLTIGDEVELMWKGRFSPPKVIFFWNRYFTLVVTCVMVFFVYLRPTLDSDTVCFASLQIETGLGTLIIGTVDLVLMLRVWALYGGGKGLLVTFSLILVAEVASMAVIQYFALGNLKVFLHLGDTLHGCFPMGNPPAWFPLMLVPPLIVSMVMTGLTLHRCRHQVLAFFGLAKRPSHSFPLMELFLRDGTFWFLAVFAVDFTELMIWCFAEETQFRILIFPSIAVYSILSSRALLNIKNIGRPTESDGTSRRQPSFSAAHHSSHTGGTNSTLVPNAGDIESKKMRSEIGAPPLPHFTPNPVTVIPLQNLTHTSPEGTRKSSSSHPVVLGVSFSPASSTEDLTLPTAQRHDEENVIEPTPIRDNLQNSYVTPRSPLASPTSLGVRNFSRPMAASEHSVDFS